ncbi:MULTISPECIES: hypothetical protein [unclassified Achromobacter]|uniref:hypothetical protein n=1 Tax=unclassified Achromobacter TaxID=2626865 RepID=UPI0011773F47|nr:MULTISPECIES: hypothetical protein [unclassified Achromobacter]
MTTIALATEDELSEAVGLKLLRACGLSVDQPPMLLRKNGFGYLRSRMSSWRQMARNQVVIVLTDLDRVNCPLELLDDWLGPGRDCPANLVLRIAVREIEAWAMADHDALRRLLGARGRFPPTPDELPDPKQHLLILAKLAPRAVKEDLLANVGAMARQGLGYNRRLVPWINDDWCPERASQRSESLRRAKHRLERLSERLT